MPGGCPGRWQPRGCFSQLESEAGQDPTSEGAQGHLHPRRGSRSPSGNCSVPSPTGKNLILVSVDPAREFRSFSASSFVFIVRKITNLTFSYL